MTDSLPPVEALQREIESLNLGHRLVSDEVIVAALELAMVDARIATWVGDEGEMTELRSDLYLMRTKLYEALQR